MSCFQRMAVFVDCCCRCLIFVVTCLYSYSCLQDFVVLYSTAVALVFSILQCFVSFQSDSCCLCIIPSSIPSSAAECVTFLGLLKPDRIRTLSNLNMPHYVDTWMETKTFGRAYIPHLSYPIFSRVRTLFETAII